MKIIVLGGDGFCGWPTGLHLSATGHEVVIVDNLSRRNIDNELEVGSLTPITPLGTRLDAWREVSDKQIPFLRFDISQHYHRLLGLFADFKPDAVVHLAEQRAHFPPFKPTPCTQRGKLIRRHTHDPTSAARVWYPEHLLRRRRFMAGTEGAGPALIGLGARPYFLAVFMRALHALCCDNDPLFRRRILPNNRHGL